MKKNKMEHNWKISKKYLSVKEASIFLSCSTKTIYNYLNKRLIEAKKINGEWAIPIESLEIISRKPFGKSLEPSETLTDALHRGKILVERNAYEELLKEVGRLQATEALLVEYKKMNEELFNRVAELEKRLKRTEERAHGFWKKWFDKG